MDGHAAAAARRLGAIEVLRRREGLVFRSYHQARIDRAAALAKAKLGERSFANAWKKGQVDPGDVLAVAESGTASDGSMLSTREREVLALLVEGRSDLEIARALFISPRTASNHVGAVLRKLQVGSRAEAAVRAVREGLA
jgi:DNA-binding NarL/FixJ family response regulator